MRLLLNAAQGLLVATAHIIVESAFMFAIDCGYCAAKLRARLLCRIGIKRLLLLIERAIDALDLFGQEHVSACMFFDLFQPLVIGFTKGGKGAHEIFERLTDIATLVIIRHKRFRFRTLGFKICGLNGILVVHDGPVSWRGIGQRHASAARGLLHHCGRPPAAPVLY